MLPSRSPHNPQRPFFVTTRANPGDILFSTTANHHKNLPKHFPQPHHSAVFSLVDPNIELPTISANEVEQVFSGLRSSAANPTVSCPPPSSQPRHITPNSSAIASSGRRANCSWLSKDDSFTPPPIKRSFGGHVAGSSQPPVPLQHPNAQQGGNRAYSLVTALQLPLSTVNSAVGSNVSSQMASASPQLHAALRKQLLAPSTTFITLVNAPKQRQENLSVRLANRAKLTANTTARIAAASNQPSILDADCVSQCPLFAVLFIFCQLIVY